MKNSLGVVLGAILVLAGLWVGREISRLMNVYENAGDLTPGAASLGLTLGIVVLVIPQLAVGAFLIWRGIQDTQRGKKAEQQRDLLSIVKAHGQIDIRDVAIEMQLNRDDVQSLLYDLVGMGLYSGYINWDEGILYSREASQLRELTHCNHCGGQLELAGKGVIRCPYCGTEYFLD